MTTDHLTLCSEERLRELLLAERRMKKMRDLLREISIIIPETAPEAWMVQEAKDVLND